MSDAIALATHEQVADLRRGQSDRKSALRYLVERWKEYDPRKYADLLDDLASKFRRQRGRRAATATFLLALGQPFMGSTPRSGRTP